MNQSGLFATAFQVLCAHFCPLDFIFSVCLLVSKEVNMVLSVHGNHKAYWGREEGVGGGKGVRRWGKRETEHLSFTLSPPVRWAAMRAILM